jgi:bacillithiol biosynthesis cysteine-adding enzyme BshC
VLTRPLGGSPLARLALAGEAPASWYRARPRTPADWHAHAEAVRAEFASGDWLRRLAPALGSSGAALARLERVAGGRGIVVTTGQQPGLFGGPMYTWSKALSAIALAEAVERVTGIPTVPVFWAATYDADFAEASVSYVIHGASVECLRMEPPEQPGRAMSDTPLGDVSALYRALERAAGSAVDTAVLELVRAAYGTEETVGSAFVKLLRPVLEPLGMVVLDAGHPAVREAEHPLMVHALAESEVVDGALRRREQEMRAQGYEPKVAHVDGLSLVFENDAGERRRIPLARSAEVARGNTRHDLEPNVILRPVAERAILPTAAYVAGPSELLYFAQTSAAADALGAAVPLAVGRWSGLVLEPHVQRILARYELNIDELRDPHVVLTRLVRERLPDDVRRALVRYRAALEAAAEDFSRTVASSTTPPLVPEAVAAGARHNIAYRLDRLERRVIAAEKRRQEMLVRDIDTAAASLFPLGTPQERLLNLIPLLARHGTTLLHEMLDRARDHAASLVGDARAAPHPSDYEHTSGRR